MKKRSGRSVAGGHPPAVHAAQHARAILLLLASVVLLVSSCGAVPVRSTPGPAGRVVYVDPHGRPRAFGGGVCPLRGRHEHGWPPTPPSAFVDDAGAWRDTRAIVSFSGAHTLSGRRCGVVGWHQHALASSTAATATTTAASALASSTARTP